MKDELAEVLPWKTVAECQIEDHEVSLTQRFVLLHHGGLWAELFAALFWVHSRFRGIRCWSRSGARPSPLGVEGMVLMGRAVVQGHYTGGLRTRLRRACEPSFTTMMTLVSVLGRFIIIIDLTMMIPACRPWPFAL